MLPRIDLGAVAMATDLFQKCEDFYQQSQFVKGAGAYPFFQPIEQSDGPRVVCDGKDMVMAVSNNYLGLTHHPKVKEAAIAATRQFGTGCSGSRFVNGNLKLHEELQTRLAAFVGKEDALVLSTGYMTNLGAIGCLFAAGDLIFSDADNHASLIDGCRQSKGTVVVYDHANAADCRAKIAATPQPKGAAIVTDGVFSMTGTIAPLRELAQGRREQPNVRLYVDDAHGFGVFGTQGRGICDHFDCTNDVDLIMGTFSKSLASIGGFIAGSKVVIEYIRHHARPLYFSAGIPPASAAAALAALEILSTEDEHRQRLWENVHLARRGFEDIGLYIMPSAAPILSIWVGPEGKVLQLAMALRAEGVFTAPVVYPAVPYGHTLIRTSYMATHTRDDIQRIVAAFRKLAPKFGIRRSDLPQDPATIPPAAYYNLDALMA